MKKIIAAWLLGLLLATGASAEVWQARYGVSETFGFKLYNADGTLDVDEADGGTEVSVSCNEGAETTATNDFVDEGTTYSITLTATEMQCERIVVVIAATTTEAFFIQTSANASAMTPSYEANVGTITAGAITAAAIATDAVDADAIAANAIDAGAIATDAITAAKIAADAIAASEIAADAIGASELAADAIGAAEVANAAIDAATFASGAIDATAIATDAIGAAEIAANAIAAAEIADGAIDEATIACSAGSFDALGISDCGTGQSGATSTTFVLRSAASFADDLLIGSTIFITGGTGAGQSRAITDYVSATDTATVETWTTTPDNTSTYEIFGTAASTGGGGLDAAGVRAAIGMASANMDTQLGTIDTNVDAILVDTSTTLDDLVDDLESRLGTPSNLGGGATVAANLSDIEGQTDDIGVAGAGLTATDDAIMTRVGAPVGASISADIASVKTDTGTTIPAAVAVIDGIVDQLLIGVNVEQMNGNDVCGTGDAGTPWTGCP